MQHIDTFINTKEKRFSLFYLILTILLFIFTILMFMCGFFLILVQNESQLQILMVKEWFQMNMMVRFATSLLKQGSHSVIYQLFNAIGILEWLMMIGFIIMEKKYLIKKQSLCYLLTYVLEIIICFSLLLPCLQSQSFHEALQALHISGITILIFSIIQLGFILYWMFRKWNQYQKALSYDVIEIKS